MLCTPAHHPTSSAICTNHRRACMAVDLKLRPDTIGNCLDRATLLSKIVIACSQYSARSLAAPVRTLQACRNAILIQAARLSTLLHQDRSPGRDGKRSRATSPNTYLTDLVLVVQQECIWRTLHSKLSTRERNPRDRRQDSDNRAIALDAEISTLHVGVLGLASSNTVMSPARAICHR